jgi:hypothetical protein
VSLAAVAINFHHSLDVQTYFSSQIAFYNVVVFDAITKLGNICLSQVLNASVGVDAGRLQDFVGTASANTVDIAQTDLNTLCVRNVNA